MIERILWYLISLAIIALLTFFSIKYKFKKKTAIYIMAGVSLGSELLKVFTHIEARASLSDSSKIVGYYITPAALPLHLCSLLIFVFFYLVFCNDEKKERAIFNFVAPVGLVSGLCGIAFATSGTDFFAPYAYQCFIYHAVLTWFSIYLFATKKVNLGKKTFFTNMVVLFLLSIVLIWINGALSIAAIANGNSINFMFLANPPLDNLPFLNLNNGWFVYYMHLMTTGVILLILISLPYLIKESRENANNYKEISIN